MDEALPSQVAHATGHLTAEREEDLGVGWWHLPRPGRGGYVNSTSLCCIIIDKHKIILQC